MSDITQTPRIPLSEGDILRLRALGQLGPDEVAFYVRETLFAENPITGDCRRLNADNLLIEGRRSLLLD